VTFLSALAASLALGASPAPVVRSFVLPRGPATIRFEFRVHAPAFRAVRLRASHGAAVRVFARDRKRIAGVGTSMHPSPGTCRRGPRFDVCESQIEGCPAPQGRWDAVLVKRSGPAARVRVSFLFSPASG